jgi:hypothetical protein
MRLPVDRDVSIMQLLLEGMSIRSAERITGVHRDTIMRLLVLAGERCQRLMDEKLKDLEVFDVEVDEIWGFVGKKESHKMKSEKQVEVVGDAYCFVGMERTSKVVLCHHLGKRDQLSTNIFMGKLDRATSDHRFQLTSDGFKPYTHAVKNHLHKPVDLARLVKVCRVSRDGGLAARRGAPWCDRESFQAGLSVYCPLRSGIG